MNKHDQKQLMDMEEKAIHNHDQTILRFSAGGIVLTITFVKNIVAPGDGQCWNVLILAWVFWIASIVSVLVSFLLSYHSSRKYQAGETDIAVKLSNAVGYLNHISIITFILGIVCMVVFASLNLGGNHEQSE